MYCIRDAATKGAGVFAATNVPRGARLLAERPLFTVKSQRDAYAAIRRLSPKDRAWLNGLTSGGRQHRSALDSTIAAWNVTRSGHFPSADAVAEYNTVVPIFQNNNFDLGSSLQAMFRDITRLNHSCLPNSQGNFNQAIEKFTIHAIRPIASGEEITISYLDEHTASRESRQMKLRRRYGFDCNCPLCDLSVPAAREREQRRGEMLEKLEEHARLTALSGKGSQQAEMDLLVDMMGIFEDEGVAGRELATMYLTAAEQHVLLGNERKAHRYAELGLATELSCLGADNPLYQRSVERVKQILP